MTGRVRERVGPARVGDDVARRPIDRRTRRRRPRRRAPPADSAGRRRRDGVRRARDRRPRPCGSCRSSTRRRCSRSRRRRARCARSRGRSERGAASSRSVPTRRWDRSCCRSRRARASRTRARRELALGRTLGQHRQQRLERVVGDRARAPDPIDLARVLDPAQRLDELTGRCHLDPAQSPAYSICCAQVTLCSSSPSREPGAIARTSSSRCAAAVSPISISARVPAASSSSPALRVATVGDETRTVARDEQDGGRAGEPGEIAHVRELRHQERVDCGLGEARRRPSRVPTSRAARGAVETLTPAPPRV